MFLKPNDPRLTKIANEVSQKEIKSQVFKKIINKMLKIAFGQQKNHKKPIMVGLAAPQIGISKRIILVDIKAYGKGLPRFAGGARKVADLRIYVNPEIIWFSKRKGAWYEGCYSLPGICGIVNRPASIKIRALTFTPQGCKRKFLKFSGYVARIFQHEIDHLNGKFFTDLIDNPNNLHAVLPKEFPLYRDREGWRNWPKKYPLPLVYSRLKKV